MPRSDLADFMALASQLQVRGVAEIEEQTDAAETVKAEKEETMPIPQPVADLDEDTLPKVKTHVSSSNKKKLKKNLAKKDNQSLTKMLNQIEQADIMRNLDVTSEPPSNKKKLKKNHATKHNFSLNKMLTIDNKIEQDVKKALTENVSDIMRNYETVGISDVTSENSLKRSSSQRHRGAAPSPLWRFFLRSDSDPAVVECRLCSKPIR